MVNPPQTRSSHKTCQIYAMLSHAAGALRQSAMVGFGLFIVT